MELVLQSNPLTILSMELPKQVQPLHQQAVHLHPQQLKLSLASLGHQFQLDKEESF
jgi:hypothetical protein